MNSCGAVLRPSSMTLGGLLKHLACVEDTWVTEVVAGEPAREPWASGKFGYHTLQRRRS